MSCFSIIVPLLAKLVSVFGGLDDSSIGSWFPMTAFIMDSAVCICWITDFAIVPPFPNHSQSCENNKLVVTGNWL